jgi:phosphate starvation-inducible PhoH-like protein
MPDPIQHRIPADGADPLALSGVNDNNLTELGRVSGLRVVLRDDHLLLSGRLEDVERTVPVAQHMIQMARTGVPFGTDDVARFFDASRSGNGVGKLADPGRVVVPGVRAPSPPSPRGRRRTSRTSRRTTSRWGSARRGPGRPTWPSPWRWTRSSRSG